MFATTAEWLYPVFGAEIGKVAHRIREVREL